MKINKVKLVNKKTNQEIEMAYFREFCRDYSIHSNEIVYRDKPDVILKLDKTIGVEITNFYLERGDAASSEQCQIPLRERIVEEAHSLYKGNGGRNIEVSFSFNIIATKKSLSKKIADFIKKIEHYPSGSVSRELFVHIPELSSIYLNSTDYDVPKWRAIQGYRIAMMNKQRLVDIIKEKEEKSKEYLKCDAYWLLVVINFFDFAQDQEIRGINIEDIHSSIFEKILIYKTVTRDIVEIKS